MIDRKIMYLRNPERAKDCRKSSCLYNAMLPASHRRCDRTSNPDDALQDDDGNPIRADCVDGMTLARLRRCIDRPALTPGSFRAKHWAGAEHPYPMIPNGIESAATEDEQILINNLLAMDRRMLTISRAVNAELDGLHRQAKRQRRMLTAQGILLLALAAMTLLLAVGRLWRG